MELKTDELNDTSKSQESYRIASFKGTEIPSEMINYVRHTFLRGLRDHNDYFRLIDKEAFYPVYGKYLSALLNKENAIVSFALLDDQTILGWSLREGPVLHYVWVKKDAWRQGIAKELVPKEVTTFTHITNKGLSVWSKENYKHLRFNPFV